jgi:hypothetical protein
MQGRCSLWVASEIVYKNANLKEFQCHHVMCIINSWYNKEQAWVLFPCEIIYAWQELTGRLRQMEVRSRLGVSTRQLHMQLRENDEF